ncbi:GNAT family N-acetyltransferase [Rhizobium lusitanum]|jgi:RimJ/RimL family protein N-acetyltransferase|uniref:Protein N-acetyltransferase, RimJ/RimL family n=1 Tax=Rhizobium lusitanum TaxID=293958 RepID=A0A1C3XJE0_9HYPH|nr:Protein N-acetyltransferase, RimJ/RimL family [Rhizobium lusitanum]
MADEIDIELFRQLEQELHRPDIRSSREAVSARLADDFLEFGSSGRVYDKHLTTNSLAQEGPSDRVTLPEVRDFTARIIAEDAVLVLYRSVWQADGGLPERTTLRSSVWKLIDGRWRMAFHQGTIVPTAVLRSAPAIPGHNVLLRTATSNDIEARLALGNDPEIIQMFGMSKTAVKPMSRDKATGWVQGIISNPYAWVIEVNGKFAGEIRLDKVDRTDRRASMAIGIYDANILGKGYGSEAIRLLLQYAFADLDLHRISVRVLAYNKRAIRAYEKCGFIIEGREREAAFVDESWHDDLIMGIVDREFLKQPSSTPR